MHTRLHRFFHRALSLFLVVALLGAHIPTVNHTAHAATPELTGVLMARNNSQNQTTYTDDPIYATGEDSISIVVTVENNSPVPASDARLRFEFLDAEDTVIGINTGEGITMDPVEATLRDVQFEESTVDPTQTIWLGDLQPGDFTYLGNYTYQFTEAMTERTLRHRMILEANDMEPITTDMQVFIDTAPHVLTTTLSNPTISGNGIDSTILEVTVTDANGCGDIAQVYAYLDQLDPLRMEPVPMTLVGECVLTEEGNSVATYQLTDLRYEGEPKEVELRVVAEDQQGFRSNDQPELFQRGGTSSVLLSISPDNRPELTITTTETDLGPAVAPILLDVANAPEARITWTADQDVHYAVRLSRDAFDPSLTCTIEDLSQLQSNVVDPYDPALFLDNRSIDPEAEPTLIPANSTITTRIPSAALTENGLWYARLCVATPSGEEFVTTGHTIALEKTDGLGLLIFDLYDLALTDEADAVYSITWRSTIPAGEYYFTINGVDLSTIDPLPADTINGVGLYSGTAITTRLAAEHFTLDDNTIELTFIDELRNKLSRELPVPKVTTPDPVDTVTILDDVDINDGLDVRDIRVEWTSYANTNDDFHSYLLYFLPETVPYANNVHRPIAYINTLEEAPGIQSFIAPGGLSTYRNTDSAGQIIQPGIAYRAYVEVQNTGLLRSTATASDNTQIYTIDGRPTLISAQILDPGSETTAGSIILTFSMDLDPDSPVDLTGITGSFENPRDPIISGATLLLTIDPLLTTDTNQTGTVTVGEDVVFTTDDVVSGTELGNAASPAIAMTDGIAPRFTITAPTADAIINETLLLEYTISEAIDPGTLKAVIEHQGGTPDPNAPHVLLLNEHSEASILHTVAFATDDLQNNGLLSTSDRLVNGARYRVTFSATDLAGNTGNTRSSTFTMDTQQPVTPATPLPVNGTGYTNNPMPTFEWIAAVDNQAGGGIDRYSVEVINATGEAIATITDIFGTTATLPLESQLTSPGTYSFRVLAIDTVGNTTPSVALTFTFVSGGPLVTGSQLTNTTRPGANNTPNPNKPTITTFFRNGDEFQLTATITEDNSTVTIDDITANLGGLTGNNTPVTPTTFENGVATFTGTVSAPSGSAAVQITAVDDLGLIGDGATLQFEVDNTAPSFAADAVSITPNPYNGLTVYRGGQTLLVSWTPNAILETNLAPNPIRITLHNEDIELVLTEGTANNGQFQWTVPADLDAGDLILSFTVTDLLEFSATYPVDSLPLVIIDNTAPNAYPIITDARLQASGLLRINWGDNYEDALSPRDDFFHIQWSLDADPEGTWNTVTTVNTVTGEFHWDMPDTIDGTTPFYLRVVSRDHAGNTVASDAHGPIELDTFDITDPELIEGSLRPDSNTLTPNRRPTISASFQDDDGIDASSVRVLLNNVEVTADATITDQSFSYTPPADLPTGENIVELLLTDLSGNPLSEAWSFWVDDLRVNMTTTPVLFHITPPGAMTSNQMQRTVIEVSTYGAEVQLQGILAGLLQGSESTIPDYTDTPELGFGYEVRTLVQPATAPMPSIPTLPFVNTFSAFTTVSPNPVDLANGTVSAQPLGSLHTYYFVVQYRLAVPVDQRPDVYNTSLRFVPQVRY